MELVSSSLTDTPNKQKQRHNPLNKGCAEPEFFMFIFSIQQAAANLGKKGKGMKVRR